MSVYTVLFFFFFKHKTAYDMRISDWSSDVCSSDLRPVGDLDIIDPAQRQRVAVNTGFDLRLLWIGTVERDRHRRGRRHVIDGEPKVDRPVGQRRPTLDQQRIGAAPGQCDSIVVAGVDQIGRASGRERGWKKG